MNTAQRLLIVLLAPALASAPLTAAAQGTAARGAARPQPVARGEDARQDAARQQGPQASTPQAAPQGPAAVRLSGRAAIPALEQAPPAPGAQPGTRQSLALAKALFTRLDADLDSRLLPREATGAEITAEAFASHDLDADGGLDQDEFLVGYHQVLVRQGRLAAPDLDAEVARLHALRRARQAQKARQEQAGAPAAGATDPAARARELQRELEQRAEAAGVAADDPKLGAARAEVGRRAADVLHGGAPAELSGSEKKPLEEVPPMRRLPERAGPGRPALAPVELAPAGSVEARARQAQEELERRRAAAGAGPRPRGAVQAPAPPAARPRGQAAPAPRTQPRREG